MPGLRSGAENAARMEVALKERFVLSVLAYVLPTFVLGFAWHLVVFGARYEQLELYRDQLAFPLGIAAMLVQAAAYAWAYPRLCTTRRDAWLRGAGRFGLVFGSIGWAYSTLAVGAKHVMTSVPEFLALETGFTLLHFAIVSPLIALVWRDRAPTD